MDNEIFITSIRSRGDFSGVFEYDGETSYFYLYSLDSSDGEKIVGAIGLSREITRDSEADLSVRWNKQETKVGVFLGDNLLALFNLGSVQRLDDLRELHFQIRPILRHFPRIMLQVHDELQSNPRTDKRSF
jgi:hypothetical protein